MFGPRGCGKTTWLKYCFSNEDSLYLDLLQPDLYDQFLLDPSRFLKLINQTENLKKRVILDEIQRLPQFLNLIHSEIQKTKRQFIMTGSSSRKLKQSGVNLLAGRAWIYDLFPFSTSELGSKFDLGKALTLGGLPEAYE
ncbi:MAG: AAA family ATPase, partial [Pseudobdellovibrionaceae bacterium]